MDYNHYKNDEYTHLRERKSLYGNNYEDDIKICAESKAIG